MSSESRPASTPDSGAGFSQRVDIVDAVTEALSPEMRSLAEHLQRVSAELSASEQARAEEQTLSLARHDALVAMRIELLRLIDEDGCHRRLITENEQRATDVAHELAERDRTIAHLEASLAQSLAAGRQAARRVAALERERAELRGAIHYIRSRSAERDRVSAAQSR